MPWPLLGAATILVLLFAMRGFEMGIPVADDYAFLARLRFQHPLDLFDSMGATYYWRPVSRQLYFSMIGGGPLDSPAFAATIHLLILLGTYALIYRIARRGFAPMPAAAIATFPLLSEAARALVTWPSGSQHLLAGLFAALTLHEAVAGRWWTTLVAGLAGVLSHESAFLAVLAVPVTTWLRKPRPSLVPPLLVVAGVALVWSAGYFVARGHGVVFPPAREGLVAFLRIPTLVGLATRATLDLEDLTWLTGTILWTLHAALLLWAIVQLRRSQARKRLRAMTPAILAGLGIFLAGALMLTWLLPDWNAWRAWMPSLALGLSLAVFYAAIAPGAAIAFAAFRLLALLVAMPGPTLVLKQAPPTASHMSYPRLVRLQRVVESTRRELGRAYPGVPTGAVVRYWNMPQLAGVGFGDSLALQVWYGDRSVRWERAAGADLFTKRTDALIEYLHRAPMPALAADPFKLDIFIRAGRAHVANDYAGAESLYIQAFDTGRWISPVQGVIADNLARVRLGLGDIPGAMAAVDSATPYHIEGGDFWETRALIALVRGDSVAALNAALMSQKEDPGSPVTRDILTALQNAGVKPR